MKERGFQLIDSAMSILVISLLAGMAAPLLGGIAGQQRLEFSGRLTLSALSAARTLAVSKCVPLQVQVHPSGTAIGFCSPGDTPALWKRLPSGVRVVEAPRRPIVFHSRGNAAPAGSLTLANNHGRVRIVISPAGRLRRERLS